MKISVYIKLKSKIEGVEKMPDGSYIVRANARPIDGEANTRIIELLSDFFKVPKRSITIVSGHASKNKIIEIL